MDFGGWTFGLAELPGRLQWQKIPKSFDLFMVTKVIVYFTSFLSSGFWDPNQFYDVAFYSIWLESYWNPNINSA